MATLRRPATRAKHNEVSIILILLLRPKTEAKGGGSGLRCGLYGFWSGVAHVRYKSPRGRLVVWTTLYTVRRLDSVSDGDL